MELALIKLLLATMVTNSAAHPAQALPLPAGQPCRATEVSRNLDFWIGDWDVYVGSTLVGTDKVERVLGGCGVIERWRDADGSNGLSLFAFDARKDLWTQNWVTENSGIPGGIKVKVLRAHSPNSTTFQGEIDGQSGKVYYDRTILTALPNGRVHQAIQASRDGISWHASFDAVYVPHNQKL